MAYEIALLNSSRIPVMLIDDFISFIFTERYSQPGDFELKVVHNHKIFKYKLLKYYIQFRMYNSRDHERLMFIESIDTSYSPDGGLEIVISGRSLSSLLDRRILWDPLNLVGLEPEVAIKKLLNSNIINPSVAKRKIEGFTYKKIKGGLDKEVELLDGTKITRVVNDEDYTGKTILEIIVEFCETWELGFRVVPTNKDFIEDMELYFQLYEGSDKSRDVEFSYLFNMVNSDYLESIENYRNVALIAGEEPKEKDDGTKDPRPYKWVNSKRVKKTPSGLLRRELFIDANNISKEYEKIDDEGNPVKDDKGNAIKETYSASEYNKILTDEAVKVMEETDHRYISEISAEIDDRVSTWKYNKHYNLGDIVLVENEMGLKRLARITEYTYSIDNGYLRQFPTFEIVQNEEDRLWY